MPAPRMRRRCLSVALAAAALAALPAAAPAATAPRLAGIYAATMTSNTLDGHPDDYFEPGGDPSKWRFTPGCKKGPCNVRFAELGYAYRGRSIVEPPVATASLTRSQSTYSGRYKDVCDDETKYTLTVQVTAFVVRKKQRIASRFKATLVKKVLTSGGDEETPPTYVDRVYKFSGRLGKQSDHYSQGMAQCVTHSV